MIIIKDKPGQLCNRLWAFAPFVCDAIIKNYKVRIIHFYDYMEYFDFEYVNEYKNIRFIHNRAKRVIYTALFKTLDRISSICFMRKTVSLIFKLLRISYNPVNSVTPLDKSKKIIIVNSWEQRLNHQKLNINEIRKAFRFKSESVNKVEEVFKDKREEFDLIIGIHVRRGDYEQYFGGRYYFSDKEYVAICSQLQAEFDNDTKIAFLLCSNEMLDLENYRQFDFFQIDEANLTEDLYALSKCDYITGPPSTYSMWASFYGQKPIFFIKETGMTIRKKDFSIIKSLDTFENGKNVYEV